MSRISLETANYLAAALERTGWTPHEVDQVREGDYLAAHRDVVRGRSHIVLRPYDLNDSSEAETALVAFGSLIGQARLYLPTRHMPTPKYWHFGDTMRVTSPYHFETLSQFINATGGSAGRRLSNYRLLRLWMSNRALIGDDFRTGLTLFAGTAYESRQDHKEYVLGLVCEFAKAEKARIAMIDTQERWGRDVGIACEVA